MPVIGGLAPALASLSTDMESPALSVRVQTADLPVAPRPPEAVETIAYFCAAELLTNVARHAEASQVLVTVGVREGALVLEVTDDGKGGAPPIGRAATGDMTRAEAAMPRLVRGYADPWRPKISGPSSTGLQGLSERVRTVDGTLTVQSPPGGPTRAHWSASPCPSGRSRRRSRPRTRPHLPIGPVFGVRNRTHAKMLAVVTRMG
ncbi:sensor histidine kinase [Streptomyces axinellae]|uniref:histidine kinase n=1 Tax=Streptomyces axinellae TaxID=552788 RepID=A0ABP6CAE3_9ACTN